VAGAQTSLSVSMTAPPPAIRQGTEQPATENPVLAWSTLIAAVIAAVVAAIGTHLQRKT
jgi:hypothetical protein